MWSRAWGIKGREIGETKRGGGRVSEWERREQEGGGEGSRTWKVEKEGGHCWREESGDRGRQRETGGERGRHIYGNDHVCVCALAFVVISRAFFFF